MLNLSSDEIIQKDMVDENLITKHLTKLKETSFDFQSNQQEDSVVLERYSFSLGGEQFRKQIIDKTKLIIRKSYQFKVEYGFVSPNRKLLLKRSGLFDTPITQYEISENPSVFDKNFMLFIEGDLVDCAKIIVEDNFVTLSITEFNESDGRGIHRNILNDWIERDVMATVVFFKNSSFNPYITNRSILDKNKKHLSLQYSGILNELESDFKYLTFVTSNGYAYSSQLVFTPERESMLSFFKKIDSGTGLERSFINIFGFRNLSREVRLDKETRLFQLPGYVMPIPSANILVFEETEDGRKYASNAVVTRHYPNFYEIRGADDRELSVLVFFSNQNESVAGFINEVDVYYSNIGDGVDSFLNAPKYVKDYVPYSLDFTIKDYKKSGFNTPLEYKLDLMSKLSDANPSLIVDYLRELPKSYDGLLVDVSKIDLENRLRLDNYIEVSNPIDEKEFEEEMYVFTFKNIDDDGRLKVGFFLDGLRYEPEYIYKKGVYEHVFIPKRLVLDDSVIEVERFEVFRNKEVVIFNDSLTPISLPIKNKLARNDVFITGPDGEFLDLMRYEISTTDDNGVVSYYDISSETEIRGESFEIHLVDGFYINKELTVHMDRSYFKEVFRIHESTNIVSKKTTFDGKFDIRNLRVFKNGKLMDRNFYDIYDPEVYQGKITLTYPGPLVEGDVIVFEYIPDRFSKVVESKRIPDTRVMYLKDIITKPFIFDWYNIYVNGRKLNRLNIDVVSPYLLQFRNLKSELNLLIFEKNAESPVFIPSDISETLIGKLWENDEPFREALMSKALNITDEEVDTFENPAIPYLMFILDAFLVELRKEFIHINPDVQAPMSIITKYPTIFNDNGVLHVNPSNYMGEDSVNVTVIHINPDEEF